jgi:hypothetical protein
MSKFPLYESLSKNILNTDLTQQQKKIFIKMFGKIDHSGQELVYALIRMYQMENNEDDTSFVLPYNGKYTGTDINFNLENFPNNLKQILFNFLHIHLEKMKEEQRIEKQNPVKRI